MRVNLVRSGHDIPPAKERTDLRIVPKEELTIGQLRSLSERLSAPEHVMDHGPIAVWETYSRGLYAVIDDDSGSAIGVIEASGPLGQMGAGWWIDTRYRGKGLGNEVVDALARHLKGTGVTGIGQIVIDTYQGKSTEASRKLAVRVKSHFQKPTVADSQSARRRER